LRSEKLACKFTGIYQIISPKIGDEKIFNMWYIKKVKSWWKITGILSDNFTGFGKRKSVDLTQVK